MSQASPQELFPPIELGLDSLLWRWTDNRLSFTGLSGGVLQLMHPGIGAGVAAHSMFFTDPWDRIIRSIPQILGVVFDGPEAEATGRKVRNYHRRIKGTDYLGREYDALDPETFWWAHATFQNMVHQIADRFSHHHLTAEERQQLYREGVEWYRRYDVSMDPVPPDHAAFVTKWSRVCADVLEMTPAAERSLDLAINGKAENLPMLPSWTVPLQRQFLTPLFRLTLIGGFPPIVRDRFAIPWSIQEQLELDAFELLIRQSWRFTPTRLRWGPEALKARRREQRVRAELAAA